MEIILKEKIKKLGNIGDIIKVKRGYAKNFLIPNNSALYATQQNIELLKEQKDKLEEESNKKLIAAGDLATALNNKAFIFIRNASEAGALYGSVTSKDIVSNLSKGNIVISAHQVKINEAIKNIGTYDVAIDLHYNVTANIVVVVARSKEDAESMFKAHLDKLNKLAESNQIAESKVNEADNLAKAAVKSKTKLKDEGTAAEKSTTTTTKEESQLVTSQTEEKK